MQLKFGVHSKHAVHIVTQLTAAWGKPAWLQK